MIVTLALAAASVASATPRPDQTGPIYVVERIRDLISPDEKVGARRAGLLCLPNGTIAWSDIAVGGVVDRRESVEDVLEDRGLRVGHGGAEGSSKRQVSIRGVITSAAFDLCAKGWALGGRNALSGTARLVVEWRVAGEADGLRHISTVDRRIDGKAGSLSAISRILLTDAASDLANWLTRNDDR